MPFQLSDYLKSYFSKLSEILGVILNFFAQLINKEELTEDQKAILIKWGIIIGVAIIFSLVLYVFLKVIDVAFNFLEGGKQFYLAVAIFLLLVAVGFDWCYLINQYDIGAWGALWRVVLLGVARLILGVISVGLLVAISAFILLIPAFMIAFIIYPIISYVKMRSFQPLINDSNSFGECCKNLYGINLKVSVVLLALPSLGLLTLENIVPVFMYFSIK